MDMFRTPTQEELRVYFTDEEWRELSEYEIKRYINLLENFWVMSELGKFLLFLP